MLYRLVATNSWEIKKSLFGSRNRTRQETPAKTKPQLRMEPSNVSRRRVRRNHKSKPLADEQDEESRLRDALKYIKAWEAKKNKKDNENQAKILGVGGVGGKRKRAPECDQTEKLTLLKLKKASKASRAAIVRVVLAKLQASLSRYHLRKRARGVFSFVATATDFRALMGGYAPVQQHANGKLFCKVGGATKSEILNTLSSILGEKDNHWFARRYYGPDFKSRRDCAFLKFDPSHPKRSHILFGFKQDKYAQVDRHGTKHVCVLGKIFCKLPRGVATVRPLKKYRKLK